MVLKLGGGGGGEKERGPGVPEAGVTCSTVCLHKGHLIVPFLPVLKFN